MIDKILKYELCLGCGLCQSVLSEEKCTMQLMTNGFYAPILSSPETKSEHDLIKSICPAIQIQAKRNKGIWGGMKEIAEAWSSDKSIRYKAASGGVVTSLAVCLWEQKLVDAVLQVGNTNGSYLYNELQVSRTKEDVIKNAQSRYAPALVFHRIRQIFDRSNESFAFVGKPCDIAAMQNFVRIYPQYASRVKYYISIFCAGMPSYNATIKTWQQSGRTDEPVSLKYRGEGWPGNFRAVFSDDAKYEISYNDSWGKVLGHDLAFRCKICPDGIGMLADIAVGDSWNTKNGYPDFTESDGKCFCIIRTEKGKKLFHDAVDKSYIECNEFELGKIKDQQRYQYDRRKLIGWRLLPVQIVTCGMLHFRGLGIFQLALSANFIDGLRNSKGTLARLLKLKNGK